MLNHSDIAMLPHNMSPSNSDVMQDLAAGRLRADAVEVDDDAGHFMDPGKERCFLMAFGLLDALGVQDHLQTLLDVILPEERQTQFSEVDGCCQRMGEERHQFILWDQLENALPL